VAVGGQDEERDVERGTVAERAAKLVVVALRASTGGKVPSIAGTWPGGIGKWSSSPARARPA
jgi:hypothetical protein